jgi:Ca2+-binding RTX toxin-like protein
MFIQGSDNAERINGTSENDEILALGGDDTVIGSAGNDTIDGGTGNNTLDFQNIGVPITASFGYGATGVIGPYPTGIFKEVTVNSEVGQTNASHIELTIAPENQVNTIDQTKGNFPGASINLETGTLSGRFSRFLSSPHNFRNFVNAIGTDFRDAIFGNSANNFLTGEKSDDQLDGRGGNDTLLGTIAEARGVGELDTLTGGAGSDRFVLGDANGAYYKAQGNEDFAKITDFGIGDVFQLGKGESYDFNLNNSGFDLFVTTGGTYDLIANVQVAGIGVGSNFDFHLSNLLDLDDILLNIPNVDVRADFGNSLEISVSV